MLASTLVACSLETKHTYEAGTRASSIPRARWAVAAAHLAAVVRAQHRLVDGQEAAGQGRAALLESHRRCRRFRRRRARRTRAPGATRAASARCRWTCRAWRRRAQAGRPWGWTGTLQVEVGGLVRVGPRGGGRHGEGRSSGGAGTLREWGCRLATKVSPGSLVTCAGGGASALGGRQGAAAQGAAAPRPALARWPPGRTSSSGSRQQRGRHCLGPRPAVAPPGPDSYSCHCAALLREMLAQCHLSRQGDACVVSSPALMQAGQQRWQ